MEELFYREFEKGLKDGLYPLTHSSRRFNEDGCIKVSYMLTHKRAVLGIEQMLNPEETGKFIGDKIRHELAHEMRVLADKIENGVD